MSILLLFLRCRRSLYQVTHLAVRLADGIITCWPLSLRHSYFLGSYLGDL